VRWKSTRRRSRSIWGGWGLRGS